MPNPLLNDECPNLILLYVTHKVDSVQTYQISFVVTVLSTENIWPEKGNILGFLEDTNIIIEEITVGTVYKTVLHREKNKEKMFFLILPANYREKIITSPTDIEVQRIVYLQNAVISKEH